MIILYALVPSYGYNSHGGQLSTQGRELLPIRKMKNKKIKQRGNCKMFFYLEKVKASVLQIHKKLTITTWKSNIYLFSSTSKDTDIYLVNWEQFLSSQSHIFVSICIVFSLIWFNSIKFLQVCFLPVRLLFIYHCNLYLKFHICFQRRIKTYFGVNCTQL